MTGSPRVPGPPVGTTVRVRVPATSANLGPGFDSLGLALGLHDEVVATVLPPGSAPTVEVTGEGADDLPRDARHLVVRALDAAVRDAGREPPPVALTCTNRLPQARGLGSSAAAAVAGVLAGRALLSAGRGETAPPDGGRDETALRLAAALEGHPDNAAACLLGGLTLAWLDGGLPRAARPVAAPQLTAVVCVPVSRASTAEARGALPPVLPHADAAFAAGRAALLVHALTTEPDLLLAATEDRLHQQYRAAGQPATTALVAALRDAGLAACTSGAGPSVLVLAGRDVSEAVRAVVAGRPEPWDVRPLPVDRDGAQVSTSV